MELNLDIDDIPMMEKSFQMAVVFNLKAFGRGKGENELLRSHDKPYERDVKFPGSGGFTGNRQQSVYFSKFFQ